MNNTETDALFDQANTPYAKYHIIKTQQLKQTVFSAIDILARWADIEVPKEAYPQFTSDPEHCPRYNQTKNILNIPPDSADKGPAIFEEASHFLRKFVKGNPNEDKDVSEFYGRLGAMIGREITRTNPLKRLFTEDNQVIYREEWKDQVEQYIKTGDQTPQIFKDNRKAEKTLGALEKIIFKLPDQIETWVFGGDTDEFLALLQKKKKKIQKSERRFPIIQNVSQRIIGHMDKAIKDIQNYDGSQDRDDITIDLEDVCTNLQIALITFKGSMLSSEQSFYNHFKGYLAAEVVPVHTLMSYKDIYTWSDKRVRRCFINPLRRRLKKGYQTSLWEELYALNPFELLK